MRNVEYRSTINKGTPKKEGKIGDYEILNHSFMSHLYKEEKEERKIYPCTFKESFVLDDTSITPYI